MEVHSAGGGIQFTVDHTRRATEDELFNSLETRLLHMIANGTTLVECKSGYGLDVETEVKMLRVIQRARRELPVGISATFCGAHSIPKYELKRDNKRKTDYKLTQIVVIINIIILINYYV